MKKKPSRGNRAGRLFSLLLFSSWIGFMAVASFFLPSFLGQLPLFQIKQVEIDGNYRIPFEYIRDVVVDLNGNLMNLRSSELKKLLNAKFENRVKKVDLKKRFTSKGIVLEVRIEERIPVAKLKLGRSYRLLDKEGVIFKPIGDEGKDLVEVKAYDKDVLSKSFPMLYDEVLSLGLPVKRIIVRRDKIILEFKRKKVILPPLEFLSDNVSERLLMIYNFPQEKVDLRFDRFILVRN